MKAKLLCKVLITPMGNLTSFGESVSNGTYYLTWGEKRSTIDCELIEIWTDTPYNIIREYWTIKDKVLKEFSDKQLDELLDIPLSDQDAKFIFKELNFRNFDKRMYEEEAIIKRMFKNS